MLAIHTRYRGNATRRAQLVKDSAAALSTLPGVGEFEFLGVEDIRARIDDAEALSDVIMALLSDGNWAVSIGITDEDSDAAVAATQGLPGNARPGRVAVSVPGASGHCGQDITAVFGLLALVVDKRTAEGREATSLVRRGLSQSAAADVLGITKQAMSQRLRAAGWQAEQQGWQLAVHLIEAAAQLAGSPPN